MKITTSFEKIGKDVRRGTEKMIVHNVVDLLTGNKYNKIKQQGEMTEGQHLEELKNNMEAYTSWEELGISNDFLFGKIMQDAELCKGLLQRILPELEIDHIEYPELQKAIKPDADAKSVRLDVYVRDDKNSVYDIDYSDFQVIPINLF